MMEPNEDVMAKLRNLDDATLRELIGEVARATGMNEGARRAAMAHTGTIRRKLQNASDAELKKAMGMIGSDKANEILKKIDK